MILLGDNKEYSSRREVRVGFNVFKKGGFFLEKTSNPRKAAKISGAGRDCPLWFQSMHGLMRGRLDKGSTGRQTRQTK